MKIKDLRKEIHTMLEAAIMAEREGCVKAVEEWGKRSLRMTAAKQAIEAIRARRKWLPPITIDLERDEVTIGGLNDQL